MKYNFFYVIIATFFAAFNASGQVNYQYFDAEAVKLLPDSLATPLNIYHNDIDKFNKIFILAQKQIFSNDKNSLIYARIMLSEALWIAENIGYVEGKINTYNALSVVYGKMKDNRNAIISSIKEKELKHEKRLYKALSIPYLNLGISFYRQLNLKCAMRYLDTAIYYAENYDTNRLPIVYSIKLLIYQTYYYNQNLAGYMNFKFTDRILEEIGFLLKKIHKTNNKSQNNMEYDWYVMPISPRILEAYYSGNIVLNLQLKNWDSAKIFLDSLAILYQMNDSFKNQQNYERIDFYYANYYFERGDVNKSKEYIKKYIPSIENINQQTSTPFVELYYKILKNEKKFIKANVVLNKLLEKNLHEYYDFWSNDHNNSFLDNYSFDLLTKKIELKIEEKQAVSKIEVALLSGGLIILMLIIVLIYRNYRNKRLSEGELIKKNHEITERNNQINIMNQQLLDLNQQLIQANHTKNLLISVIAHDLKNPMTAIRIGLQVLTNYSNKLTEKKRNLLTESIDLASERFQVLLLDLLNWSKIHFATSEIQVEEFKLQPIIDKAFQLWERNAIYKKIKFCSNIPTDFVMAGDDIMVASIIRNTLNNAIKYSNFNGTIEITHDFIIKNDNKYLCISISDNGIGMSQETIDNILFTNIMKSSDGTIKEHGTGVGLILCKDFIKLHNGFLEIESEQGKGTKFSYYFPKNM